MKYPVYVGLFRDSWGWSDGSGFSFRHWEAVPNNQQGNNTCAATMLKNTGRWKDCDCGERKPFICYDDKVILINENKTWVEALYYCREHHHDLVYISNLDEQRWVQDRAKKANSPYVWLGLRYTCTLGFWFWVSDNVVSYENWAPNGKLDECDMSGAMDSGGQHDWTSKQENMRFNFICSKG
uniref:C-type mannose receptor 2-like n=1 Tax=Monopterus albus TaxID=43700 RepID=UPI0009B36707|nr:C-type mannose receptor 2-like [Monopterus albus]